MYFYLKYVYRKNKNKNKRIGEKHRLLIFKYNKKI